MKYGFDIGVYNLSSERILPRAVKQKNFGLYLYKKHFCVLWKLNRRTSLLDAIVEIENNFRYEETQINHNISKQLIEYKFPISYEMNCLCNAFGFDLESYIFENSQYCESYGAGVYHLNNLFWSFLVI